MRIADRGPVAGEVLATRQHARTREPAREGEREPRDGARRRPEGAVADDAVAGVRPHVEDRGEVEIDAHRAELASHRAPHCLGETRVPALAHEGHGGEVGEGRVGQPVDAPALVVERHQRWDAGARRVDVGHQPAKLLGGPDVALEEDDAARAALGEELPRLAVQGRARQANHEELARRPTK